MQYVYGKEKGSIKSKSRQLLFVLAGVFLLLGLVVPAAPALAAVPAVTTDAATSVGPTTATLNGNITGASPNCDQRGFVWDTSSHGPPGNVAPRSSGYALYWTESGSFDVGAYTYGASSLTAGATYYYRAAVHNSHSGSTWAYGAEQTFYTLPGDPSNLTDTTSTSDSISLSWMAGAGAEQTLIRYRTDQYPTSTSDGTQAYLDTGTSTTVSSLSAGQIYYFRAWAVDTTSGYSTGTSDKTAYTLPGNPSNLATANPTSSTLDVSWTKGTGGDKTMVRYKTGAYPTSTSDGTQLYFDTGTSQQATGLSPSTTYYFRAWAYNSDSTYYSSGTSDTTGNTAPPSTAAEILTYSFAAQTGPATINSGAGTIGIEVAYGTDVRSLAATFTTSADITSIKVGGVDQVSGVTANDFSSPVTYVVTAQDETTKDWVVTVTVAPALSREGRRWFGSILLIVLAAAVVPLFIGRYITKRRHTEDDDITI